MFWHRLTDRFMRGVIFVTAAFLALGAGVMVVKPGGAPLRPADPNAPEATVYAWVEAHRDGERARAFALLSPAAQRTQSFDVYNRRDFSVFGITGAGPYILVVPLRSSANDAMVRVAIAQTGIEIRRAGDGPGERSLRVKVVRDEAGWRIDSVDPWPWARRSSRPI